MEQAAADVVRAGLRDDVDDAARRPPEFRVGAGRDHLELLHRFERDVDGRALPAHLLAEESIVVVAAVEADVVEHAALSREVDLVAVRSLDDADAGRQREQVLELAAEDWRRLNRPLIERRRGRGPRGLDGLPLRRHGDRLGHAGQLHHRIQGDVLAHGDEDVLLHERREIGELERDGVPARRQLQRHEAAVPVGHERAHQVRVEVAHFHVDTRKDRAAGVGDDAFDHRGRNLRLRRRRRGQTQRDADGYE